MFVSKEAFLKIFAYNVIHKKDTSENKIGKLGSNLVRGISYLPIIGVICNLGLMIAAFMTIKNDKNATAKAFGLRAVGALAGPLILPIVDIAAVIWKTKK